jgi:hypothetical protein
MGTIIKLLIGIIVVGGVILVTVVVAGVLVGGIWYQSIPKVEVVNGCSDPIVIPDQFRIGNFIPDTIPTDAHATIPLVWGSGVYRLYEEGDATYLEFPRDLPLLEQRVRVGGTGLQPKVSFDGAMVTVPMGRDLGDQLYQVQTCP